MKTKLEKEGIQIIETEESYTSKCDALSLEKICYHSKYSGTRKTRSLYITKTGKKINADINGAINIMRKKIKLTKIKGLGIFNPINLYWWCTAVPTDAFPTRFMGLREFDRLSQSRNPQFLSL